MFKPYLKKTKLPLLLSSSNRIRPDPIPIEDYRWPTKIDIVLASSALPYFDPLKIKAVMTNIYQNLSSGGHFIGNFFASKYVGSAMDVTREMGAWFVNDKDTVGYLLAGHGYEVIECDKGGKQNPHSVIFTGKKFKSEVVSI